jgi:hypothetical protein
MPLNRRSIPLLEPTGTNMTVTGAAVKGDSYYGYTDGLHTIQVQYQDFAGRFRINATLVENPTEADWFPLRLAGFTLVGRDAYKEWATDNTFTGTEAYTFQGNYLWIRVEMDRSQVGDGTTYNSAYGQITQSILSA